MNNENKCQKFGFAEEQILLHGEKERKTSALNDTVALI